MNGSRRRVLAGLGLALILLLGYLAYQRFAPRPPLAAPLPQPNGYDDFVQAGRMIDPFTGSLSLTTATARQLRPVVATNAEALTLLRAGLDRECLVPIQFDPGFASRYAHGPQFQRIQQLRGLVKFALARRAYELETGKRLRDTFDLVPAYLKAVPASLTTFPVAANAAAP